MERIKAPHFSTVNAACSIHLFAKSGSGCGWSVGVCMVGVYTMHTLTLEMEALQFKKSQ